jgi:glycosyltransferase involved in cell wall biosynthesis
MNAQQRPLVSVVTPVYNGESYLRECVESVLSQTYQNWEYIILDNCSDDRTYEIVEEYRLRDSRIRLYHNDELLPIIANHNKAFGLISSESKYCKVVSADDWIFPECLERMVGLAEANPSVGIVGSYQLSGGDGLWYVRNFGLPYSTKVVAGREICRIHLLGMLSVFGSPTSDMYRSDLVRSTNSFYPNPTAEADVSACFHHLRNADFGFVHQVLSHERLHRARVTTISLETNAYLSAAISDCQTYGGWYLRRKEHDARLDELLKAYYAYLSKNALKFRGRDFWQHHARRLNELGFPLDIGRLFAGIALKLFGLILSPKDTFHLLTVRMRIRRALRG